MIPSTKRENFKILSIPFKVNEFIFIFDFRNYPLGHSNINIYAILHHENCATVYETDLKRDEIFFL